MSTLIEIGDVMARCTRADMPDEEAEAMIEAAALSAADQVREQCRIRRQNEKDLYARRRQMDAKQAQVAENNRRRIEAEAEGSRKRTEALRKAEAVNGPRRV